MHLRGLSESRSSVLYLLALVFLLAAPVCFLADMGAVGLDNFPLERLVETDG
ncbi:hypothetical protein SAMN04488056_10781 [Cohaesibacter marisflavi]|uniref:Uncharacterized protein n=1 Tax=Cohaesibacter marisflavi TaxID=655353 RepID=A0A1I5HRB9_9HYPH|nr:hypothetical protein SAMN04488056_10781 [Cohaesibacter marisflavi]